MKAMITLRKGKDWQEAILRRRHKCGSKLATYNFYRGTCVPQLLICNGCGEDLL